MSKKPLIALGFLVFICPAVRADIVLLKGGQKLEGEIVEKGAGYEIKNEFGAWTFTRDEVVKMVRSVDKIQTEGEALHQKARALYDEALPFVDTDPKVSNAKLRQGIELLRKIVDLYTDALETYTDPKYGHLQKTIITLFQEMRLYRDKFRSDVTVKEAPAVVTPPPAPAVKGPIRRPPQQPQRPL